MIGKLTGTIDAVGESHCLIDVGGVGYEVQASARTLQTLTPGKTVSLTIDTHVREDAIRLYGFASELERAWFRTLQSVQGVGSKVALSALGVLAPHELTNAVTLGDWAAVERTPGVGKKLAQRIVAELKDKAPASSVTGIGEAVTGPAPSVLSAVSDAGSDAAAAAEAVSALTNLGYQPAQAGQAVAAARQALGHDADTAALIRGGLKELAR